MHLDFLYTLIIFEYFPIASMCEKNLSINTHLTLSKSQSLTMVSKNCILSLSVDPNYLPLLDLILVTTNPLHFLQHAMIDRSYCLCSNYPLVWKLSTPDEQGSCHNLLQMANLCDMHHDLSGDCGSGSQSHEAGIPIKVHLDLSYCCCYSVAQSCLTVWNPVDCSSADFSVPGILQTRTLEGICHFLLQGIFPTQWLNILH